jgi:hypothetical protein
MVYTIALYADIKSTMYSATSHFTTQHEFICGNDVIISTPSFETLANHAGLDHDFGHVDTFIILQNIIYKIIHSTKK